MRSVFLVIGASTMISGCVAALPLATVGGSFLASDEMTKGTMSKAERRMASVASIGHDLQPRAIEIEDVEKGDDFDSWTAETAIGNYRCTQLKGRRSATCKKMKN